MKYTVILVISLLAGSIAATHAQQSLRRGVWGGNGIQLTVTGNGAGIDYGCDSGTIDGRPRTDSGGKFLARGTHVFGLGGPRNPGGPAVRPHQARYAGVVRGNKLELSVLLPGLKRNLGKYTLQFGQRAILERCG